MQVSIKRIIPILNIFIALGFLAFSVYLFAFGEFKDDTFRAYMAAVSAALSLMPTFIYHTTDWKKHISYHAMNMAEMLTAFLLVLNGLGALGFYRTTQYYDLALHIINPFFITIVLSILIAEYLQSRKKYSLLRVQMWAVIAVFGSVFLWEIWEFWGDQVFGTEMFGQDGEWYEDTISDVLGGFLGIAAALFFNTFYLKYLLSWLHKRN